MVSIDRLEAHPRNPNRHSQEQIALLARMIAHQGWRHPVTVSRQSNLVITGHARLSAAALLQLQEVPVDYQDFPSEEDELAHLVADNRIQELAHLDPHGVHLLLQELQNSPLPDLQLTGFTDQEVDLLMQQALDSIPAPEHQDEDLPSVYGLKPRELVSFPSTEPYGIPALLPDDLSTVPEPLQCWAGPDVTQEDPDTHYLYNWGTDSRRGLPLHHTVVAFYCDDQRFEQFWQRPHVFTAKLLNSNVPIAISPNFSLWPDTPLALAIFNTYRSRYLGRYFQEAGLKVIPDVHGITHDPTLQWCLAGIPPHPPAIAYQIQAGQKTLSSIHRIKQALKQYISKLKPSQLLLYVGETAEDILQDLTLPQELHLIIVKNRLILRERRMHEDSKLLKRNRTPTRRFQAEAEAEVNG